MPPNGCARDNSSTHSKHTGTHLRSFTKIFLQVLHAKAWCAERRAGRRNEYLKADVRRLAGYEERTSTMYLLKSKLRTHHVSVDALGVILAFVMAFRTLVPAPATRCLNADLDTNRHERSCSFCRRLVCKDLGLKPKVQYTRCPAWMGCAQ